MTWFLAMGGRSMAVCTNGMMLVAKEGSSGAEAVGFSIKVSAATDVARPCAAIDDVDLEQGHPP